jgi:hypothetical protein
MELHPAFGGARLGFPQREQSSRLVLASRERSYCESASNLDPPACALNDFVSGEVADFGRLGWRPIVTQLFSRNHCC